MLARWLLPVCLVVGCASEPGDELVSDSVADAATDDDKADGPAIAFTPVDGLTLRSTIGKTEEGRVIRTATGFRTAFGTAPPTGFDFDHEWLAIYSAGVRTTGGYHASIERVRLSDSGLTVKVTSHLTMPGSNCIVTQALTKPVAVVKFAAQPSAARSRFTKLAETKACGATGACDMDLRPILDAQTAGMTYMSESDYPLTYVTYGAQGAPSVDKLRTLTGTAPGTAIEEVSFSDLFDRLGEAYDPSDPYIVDYAMKYQALRAVLEQHLTNLTVIRIGEISIDVYIVGETSCGELVGLETTSIET
jgi:hypothetical protein